LVSQRNDFDTNLAGAAKEELSHGLKLLGKVWFEMYGDTYV
jgi:hypothetical protein